MFLKLMIILAVVVVGLILVAAFVHLCLEFFKPFKGTNIAQFTFQPEQGQTRVTWTMSGQYGFIPS